MSRIIHSRDLEKSISLFSKRDQAYMEDPSQFSDFLAYQPKIENFGDAIDTKLSQYSFEDRRVLIQEIKNQYSDLGISHNEAIAALEKENAVNIVTAHQPCLFTGPLYFVYKIASTIALARAVEKRFPGKVVVPVYVLGSEDHDFEEINHVNIFRKKFEWQTSQKGAVGRMKLDDIDTVIAEIEGMLSGEPYGEDIMKKLREAYKPTRTLAQATHHFVHTLFGNYGLVVIDLDSQNLKVLAKDLFEKELASSFSHAAVNKNQKAIEALGFSSQIHARDINLFYLTDDARDRIERTGTAFKIDEKTLNLKEELTVEQLYKLSPNVVLRPLYQQLTTPCIAYVGGGAEVAYWMEIKSAFDEVDLVFPILIRRDSAMYISKRASDVMKQISFDNTDLFDKLHIAQENYLKTNVSEDWSLDEIKNEFKIKFDALSSLVEQKDSGLTKMVAGFQTQHENFLSKLESKIRKSLKSQHDVAMNRIEKLWTLLYPENGLQERRENIIPIYARLGQDFIDTLIENFDPLQSGMHILQEKDEA